VFLTIFLLLFVFFILSDLYQLTGNYINIIAPNSPEAQGRLVGSPHQQNI